MTNPAHEIHRRVEFHETDAAGLVHFSNFFRYMEACEHAFLRELDVDPGGLSKDSETGWPRVHATCDYRAPARFGDLLAVRLFVGEVRERSVRYDFHIRRDATLIAEGSLTTAHVSTASGDVRAVALPAALGETLRSLAAGR